METDRGAVLTVRLAAKGLLDFGRANIHDVRWWRKTNALIRSLSKESSYVVATTSLNYQLAILTIPRLSDAGMKEAQEKAGVAVQDIWNALYPWAATEQKRQKEDEYAKILADYKAQIGDPSDPEFIRGLEERIREKRLKRASQGPVESDSDRLERRLAERG